MVELECYTCGYKTHSKKDLTVHLEQTHIETRTCETCKRIFQTIKGYKCHRRLRTCLHKERSEGGLLQEPPTIPEVVSKEIELSTETPVQITEIEPPPSRVVDLSVVAVPNPPSWIQKALPYVKLLGTCVFLYTIFRMKRR